MKTFAIFIILVHSVSLCFSQDACSSHPCFNGGSCKNVTGVLGYECRCPIGTLGMHCESIKDNCGSNPCQFGGTCENKINDYVCHCPRNNQGKNCEKLIDDNNSCHGKCQNDGNCIRNKCKCADGYIGTFCEIFNCSKNPCLNSGRCVNHGSSYKCDCLPGFKGYQCETNIDDCADDPCLHGQCIDQVNDYICRCNGSFTGKNCETDLCNPNPCLNSASCVHSLSTTAQYKCICLSGFYGPHCEKESNICDDRQACYNGGICTGNSTSFTCMCPKGYEGNRCQVMHNYCFSNPCGINDYCVSIATGYKCVCGDGFSGSVCLSLKNKCLHRKENSCMNGGKCIDLINGYTCKCPKGYDGELCQHQIDICKYKPCMNGGACSNELDDYVCTCPVGFTGRRCQCPNSNHTCIPNNCDIIGTEKYLLTGDSYKCSCRSGWSGHSCDNYASCKDLTCQNNGTCINSVYGAVCICQLEFSGEYCQHQKSVCFPNPCQNQGKCVPRGSGYVCSCPDWVMGSNCDVPIYLSCNESPCFNGGTCVEDNGTYTCHCPKYWSGFKCQDSIAAVSKFCKSHNCQEKGTNGVCDPECNFEECNFDNTECSYGVLPWRNCTQKTKNGQFCVQVFQNGVCNSECSNQNCLFDGFDCNQPVKSCPFQHYCSSFYGNGHCDYGCNTAECGWDGFDCDKDKNAVVEGSIFMVLLMDVEEFKHIKNEFLHTIGRLVRAVVSIRKTPSGEEMIYRWIDQMVNSSVVVRKIVDDHLVQSGRSRRSVIVGTRVYLEVSNRGSHKNGQNFGFNNSESVAQYLAESLRVNSFDARFDVLQIAASKLPPSTTEDAGNNGLNGLLIILLLACLLLVAMLVIGVVVLRQKRARGITWFPENFKKGLVHVAAKSEDKESQNTKLNINQMYVFKDQTTPPPSNEGSHQDDSDESPQFKKFKVDRMESVDIDHQWKLEHLYISPMDLTPLHGLDIIPFDVNLKGPNGYTPLMLAAMRGSGLGDEEEITNGSESSDGPEIDSSVNVDVMTNLISQGAAINDHTDKTGETALHLAARYGRAAAAKILLDAGADPNVMDCTGRTPLHSAVAADALSVFKVLVKNRATNLNAKMDCGTTALMLACRLSIDNTVESLILSGADIEAVDNSGKTALHWAAAVNNVVAVLILLNSNANKDALTNREETPIFLASRDGAYECVKLLLDYFAKRELADNMNCLPRDVALERRHLDIVELLDSYKLTFHQSPHLSGRVNSPGCLDQDLMHQSKHKRAKNRKKSAESLPLPSKKSPAIVISKHVKARRKKDESKAEQSCQYPCLSLPATETLSSMSSPDMDYISSTTNCVSVMTSELTKSAEHPSQSGQLANFTNVDLLSSWNQGKSPIRIVSCNIGPLSDGALYQPVSSWQKRRLIDVTGNANLAEYNQATYPPDLIKQPTSYCDLHCSVPTVHHDLFLSVPKSHSIGPHETEIDSYSSASVLPDSTHCIGVTTCQLLTPSPDSTGHWSSHSEPGKSFSSPTIHQVPCPNVLGRSQVY